MVSLRQKVNNKIEENKLTAEDKFIWLAEEYNTPELRSWLREVGPGLKAGQLIKDNRNAFIKVNKAELQLLDSPLLAKKFRLTRLYDKLRFCLLNSKAVRSLRIALALEEIGLRTPKPVAVVEKRGAFNQLLYSYYITEYIDFDYNLLDIIPDDNHPRRQEVKKWLPMIAQDIKQMHQAGIIHQDLHAGNILAVDVDSQPKFYYIDLNRGRIKEELDFKQRAQDLARLKFTRKEKKIFMEQYAPHDFQKLLQLMIQQRRRRKKFKQLKSKLRNLYQDE